MARRLSALCGALSLLAMVPVSHARSVPVASVAGPWDLYEAKLGEADTAVQEGRWLEAVQKYRLAYEALPASDRAGDFGEDIVNRVTALTRQDEFLETAGIAGLEEASALIESYLDDVERFQFERKVALHEKNLAKLALVMARVRKQEEEEAAADEPPPPVLPSPIDETAAAPVPRAEQSSSSVPRDTAPAPRRALMISLSVGGAALALGSVGLFLNGAKISGHVDQVESDLSDPTLSEEDRQIGETYVDENNPRAIANFAGGISMLLAGLGLIGGGIAVDVIDRKRARASASLSPSISRSGAGLSLVGRF